MSPSEKSECPRLNKAGSDSKISVPCGFEVRFLNIALGQIVVSKAGRDAGKRFLVAKVVDEQFVQITDGDLRRVEKPKRKKIKHLEPTGEVAETIKEKLESNARITNPEVRKALAVSRSNPESMK